MHVVCVCSFDKFVDTVIIVGFCWTLIDIGHVGPVEILQAPAAFAESSFVSHVFPFGKLK